MKCKTLLAVLVMTCAAAPTAAQSGYRMVPKYKTQIVPKYRWGVYGHVPNGFDTKQVFDGYQRVPVGGPAIKQPTGPLFIPRGSGPAILRLPPDNAHTPPAANALPPKSAANNALPTDQPATNKLFESRLSEGSFLTGPNDVAANRQASDQGDGDVLKVDPYTDDTLDEDITYKPFESKEPSDDGSWIDDIKFPSNAGGQSPSQNSGPGNSSESGPLSPPSASTEPETTVKPIETGGSDQTADQNGSDESSEKPEKLGQEELEQLGNEQEPDDTTQGPTNPSNGFNWPAPDRPDSAAGGGDSKNPKWPSPARPNRGGNFGEPKWPSGTSSQNGSSSGQGGESGPTPQSGSTFDSPNVKPPKNEVPQPFENPEVPPLPGANNAIQDKNEFDFPETEFLPDAKKDHFEKALKGASLPPTTPNPASIIVDLAKDGAKLIQAAAKDAAADALNKVRENDPGARAVESPFSTPTGEIADLVDQGYTVFKGADGHWYYVKQPNYQPQSPHHEKLVFPGKQGVGVDQKN